MSHSPGSPMHALDQVVAALPRVPVPEAEARKQDADIADFIAFLEEALDDSDDLGEDE